MWGESNMTSKQDKMKGIILSIETMRLIGIVFLVDAYFRMSNLATIWSGIFWFLEILAAAFLYVIIPYELNERHNRMIR